MGMRQRPVLWGLEPGGATRVKCKRCSGAFAPDQQRMVMFQAVLGAYMYTKPRKNVPVAARMAPRWAIPHGERCRLDQGGTRTTTIRL